MADALTRAMLAIGIALAGTVQAAEGQDPTRPPDAATAPAAGAATADAGRLVLQSVLVGPDRRVAVVSGMPLTIGDEVMGHRLLRVTGTGVVLQGPAGLVTLSLYPSVVQRIVKLPARGPMKMASTRRKPKS